MTVMLPSSWKWSDSYQSIFNNIQLQNASDLCLSPTSLCVKITERMEQEPQLFYPERKQGILLHAIILVILIGLIVAAVWATTSLVVGSGFVFFIILIVLLSILIPVVLYRGYALLHARYILERDGLRLRWGLRTEDIPLSQIDWVRQVNESGYSVQPPLFSIPGAILGERHVQNLGTVEFLASDLKKLILISTPQKTFAISPQNPRKFEVAFLRSFEMGSLFPIPSQSSRPAAFIQSALKDRYAKYLLPMNIGLLLLLWLVSGFVIMNNPQLPLGFSPQGLPLDLVPSQQLLLIPVLGLFVLIIDVIAGLFFFRQEEHYQLAYLLWIGGIITPTLLIISMVILSFNA